MVGEHANAESETGNVHVLYRVLFKRRIVFLLP